MKHPAKAFGLSALALCVAWTAACQSSKPNPALHEFLHKQIFYEMDVDADGRIDSEEFTRYFYEVSFNHHDRDADGRLSLVEWVGSNPESEHEALFAEMDTDGSGWLVVKEYASHPTRTITVTNTFMTLDRNGDAYVEADEIIN